MNYRIVRGLNLKAADGMIIAGGHALFDFRGLTFLITF
jgi:hypothetical protein